MVTKQIVEKKASQTIHRQKIRFITAASLFDGHDASINMIRRLLQNTGAEIIHLGHNRSVLEVVNAAIQENAHGILVSSYQGGHLEYFKYMLDLLNEYYFDPNSPPIRIFGGGGGVIIPEEIKELHKYGITRIFSPEDGASMGLQGMIDEIMKKSDFSNLPKKDYINLFLDKKLTEKQNQYLMAKIISLLEENKENVNLIEDLSYPNIHFPIIGITGTGGAGKSSFTDELILRFLEDNESIKIAVLSIDPAKRRSGGALLGDRIRMNSIDNPRVFMRSFSVAQGSSKIIEILPVISQFLFKSGYNLVFIETPGIGQGESSIIDVSDISIYVMTPEYGAASQLEKIDMLDFADLVIVNKFDRRGALDAVHDIRKQIRRNKNISYAIENEKLPVFGTISSHFNDTGVNAAYLYLLERINEISPTKLKSSIDAKDLRISDYKAQIIPSQRVRYLAEIAETVRDYKARTNEQINNIKELDHLMTTKFLLLNENTQIDKIETLIADKQKNISTETVEALKLWDFFNENYRKDEFSYKVRDKTFKVNLKIKSLSGNLIPRISLPHYSEKSEILRFMLLENLPGYFPFTAGVFPFKRLDEDPKRQFAGEGPPKRTNERFHLLTENDKAKRLSTAFDSVTLYGEDPDYRPDIFGKIGESGVSVASLEDMKILYAGFDLIDPNTSVSMTINGPAPIILAFFFNTAIDQQIMKFIKKNSRRPNTDELEDIKTRTLTQVRGTVQADILKEDQAQNTCIFSTQFALRMMGDIQEFFIANNIKNFYSVSISGYHIAEAGANPISQLAFTLANGFTYVEYYLSRGMAIDDFAPNLSFFFSNGLDPEYTVIGRVARRIWAIAMKNLYHANNRSQKLKYHIQTSGRSLHAQDIQFNDIRTTLQALIAFYDNCNSLHTNAYDEAITTPTAESVRRAMAIQLIITNEFGWNKTGNPHQGSFIIEELTELVEEAVLSEFVRLTERGGVLGAMELGYQRSKIQDESLYYERLKHNGELPIIGVNTYKNPDEDFNKTIISLSRSNDEEKKFQIAQLDLFKEKNKNYAEEALAKLKQVAKSHGNIFEELLNNTVKYASLGQITNALYEVGGKYRRGM